MHYGEYNSGIVRHRKKEYQTKQKNDKSVYNKNTKKAILFQVFNWK